MKLASVRTAPVAAVLLAVLLLCQTAPAATAQLLSGTCPTTKGNILKAAAAVLDPLATSLNSKTWVGNWVNQAADPCYGTTTGPSAWYGINCNADNTTMSVSIWGGNLPAKLAGSAPAVLSCLGASLLEFKLTSHKLTGPLPNSWSNLTALTTLDLGDNLLTGTPIPSSWLTRLTRLTKLSLYNNRFSATPASSWARLSPSLGWLDLRGNLMTGTLPSTWPVDMKALYMIDLSRNSLSGAFPASWLNWTALRYLFLHYNKLSGAMPKGTCGPRLNQLDLSYNVGLYGCWPCVNPSYVFNLAGTQVARTCPTFSG